MSFPPPARLPERPSLYTRLQPKVAERFEPVKLEKAVQMLLDWLFALGWVGAATALRARGGLLFSAASAAESWYL